MFFQVVDSAAGVVAVDAAVDSEEDVGDAVGSRTSRAKGRPSMIKFYSCVLEASPNGRQQRELCLDV